MEKQYSNGEITVVWRPESCIHSTLCWRGLISVFNPKKRPWIDMAGGATDEIIAAVEKCPSKALSWFRNGEEAAAAAGQSKSSATAVVIELSENGPLLIQGPVVIKSPDGGEAVHPQTTALCRCGASANKPYCDGSHRKMGFRG